jgi:hypothetical protein
MRRRYLWIAIGILLVAAAFRLAVVHWLPNDTPGDGLVYAQMARNVLEQHVFSHDAQPPYSPSLVRLPGYPLFLATVYSIFGHTNNGAVRIFQALIDTATCGLIALLAYYWQPDEEKKWATAIAALALAAVCPFTTIYAATILSEVPTNFLIIAMFLTATLALREGLTTEDPAKDRRKSIRPVVLWWMVTGLIGGISVFFRPDNGLFVAAVGLTLVAMTLSKIFLTGEGLAREGSAQSTAKKKAAKTGDEAKRRRLINPNPASFKKTFGQLFLYGAVFSLAFAIVLVPWTIRNWRLFHVFQPLAPAHAEMPGEFVPRGYQLWVRTWIDDDSFIAPFLWAVDTDPIDIDDVPPYAFDSPEEKNRVAALLDKYNDPDSAAAENEAQISPAVPPEPSPSPAAKQSSPSPTPASQNSNAEESEETEESEEEQKEEKEKEQHGPVEMTPEIDAGFAQIARERIGRHPFQFYILLPLKRARAMWFDTHSQYWPFEGTLLPFEDLDYEGHQQYWLPLFAGLTAFYTLLGLGGGWVLLTSERFAARRWLLLVVLAMVLRLLLFSSIENPEPRYLVEFFPLLSVLGGIAIVHLASALKKPKKTADAA